MPARAFDRNAQARRRRDALYNSEGNPRTFEQRPLLDVQLHESSVITFREFHILKISVEARFRFAVAILQFRSGFRGKRSRKQSASQAADSKTRRLFRSEYQKFNRMSRPETAPVQRTNRFETTKDSNDAIIFPGVRNRVNMRTSSDRRSRRIRAVPARKNISKRILADGKSCFFAKRNHPSPRFQIRRRENNSRDCGRLRVRNRGQRFYF